MMMGYCKKYGLGRAISDAAAKELASEHACRSKPHKVIQILSHALRIAANFSVRGEVLAIKSRFR
jgi:hypothetical protein